jgi:RimJ/RimL family protein N-acetyltransferase
MITLEHLSPDDCKNIVKWNEGKDFDFLIQWSGHTSYTYPITVEQIIEKMNDKHNVFYKIMLDSKMIGSICLLFFDNGPTFVCRFIIKDEMRSKGYGTQALKKLSSIFFNDYNFDQLKLGVYVYNVDAIRCYEKAGFRVESYSEQWNSFKMRLDKHNFAK